MLAPTQQLKKETIALATNVEQFFLSDGHNSNPSIVKEENLHKIHQSTFRILMSKRSLDQKQVRFLTTVIRSSTSLFKIFQLSAKSQSSKLSSQIFSFEINDIKKDIGNKLQKCIDAFSYEYKELILNIHEDRGRIQVNIQYAEKKILEEIENEPKLMKQGFAAIKKLSLYQYIDEEINEMMDHILYNQGYVGHYNEEKVEKVNMLDYISSNGLTNAMRGTQ